ncbi:MAG: hypothetical protein QW074_07840 [Candidatus Caldarchaeum sp.]
MEKAVLTVIILIAGLGMTLAVLVTAYGWLGVWGTSERVVIKYADITVNPQTGLSYVTVEIHNAGGIRLTGCSVRVLPNIDVDDVSTSDLPPGASATFFEPRVPGLQPSQVYVVEAVCRSTRGGPPVEIIDRKSVQAHV